MRATRNSYYGKQPCVHCDRSFGKYDGVDHWTIVGEIADSQEYWTLLHSLRFSGRYNEQRKETDAHVCDSCVQSIAGTCDVCGQSKQLERDHCSECARAFAVSTRSDNKLTALRDAILSEVKAHIDTIRTEERTVMATNIEATKKNPIINDTTRTEMEDGVWQGSIATLTEKARDTIAMLLTADMDAKRAKIARGYFVEALRGRWGVPLVAAVVGAALHAAEQRGLVIPFLSSEIAARVGREFRVLGYREVTRNVTSGGADILTKYGSGIMESLASIGKLADAAKGDRIKVTPAE